MSEEFKVTTTLAERIHARRAEQAALGQNQGSAGAAAAALPTTTLAERIHARRAAQSDQSQSQGDGGGGGPEASTTGNPETPQAGGGWLSHQAESAKHQQRPDMPHPARAALGPPNPPKLDSPKRKFKP